MWLSPCSLILPHPALRTSHVPQTHRANKEKRFKSKRRRPRGAQTPMTSGGSFRTDRMEVVEKHKRRRGPLELELFLKRPGSGHPRPETPMKSSFLLNLPIRPREEALASFCVSSNTHAAPPPNFPLYFSVLSNFHLLIPARVIVASLHNFARRFLSFFFLISRLIFGLAHPNPFTATPSPLFPPSVAVFSSNRSPRHLGQLVSSNVPR